MRDQPRKDLPYNSWIVQMKPDGVGVKVFTVRNSISPRLIDFGPSHWVRHDRPNKIARRTRQLERWCERRNAGEESAKRVNEEMEAKMGLVEEKE